MDFEKNAVESTSAQSLLRYSVAHFRCFSAFYCSNVAYDGWTPVTNI